MATANPGQSYKLSRPSNCWRPSLRYVANCIRDGDSKACVHCRASAELTFAPSLECGLHVHSGKQIAPPTTGYSTSWRYHRGGRSTLITAGIPQQITRNQLLTAGGIAACSRTRGARHHRPTPRTVASHLSRLWRLRKKSQTAN